MNKEILVLFFKEKKLSTNITDNLKQIAKKEEKFILLLPEEIFSGYEIMDKEVLIEKLENVIYDLKCNKQGKRVFKQILI